MFVKARGKINVQIIRTLLILFTIAGVLQCSSTYHNMRGIYEENFTERVLLTNNLIAAMVDGESVEYFAQFISLQDDSFKERQVQFLLDRRELARLQSQGASESKLTEVHSRIEAFQNELAEIRPDEYWDVVEMLSLLNIAGNSKSIYVYADLGVTDKNGRKLYTCLFDTRDDGVYESPSANGMGTVKYGTADMDGVYDAKTQMEKAFFEDETGQYYAYAPLLDDDGNVVAILGTNICPGAMRQEIRTSLIVSIISFVLFETVIILTIFIFLRHSVTKPLLELTKTAEKLAEGDVDTRVPNVALSQRNELGTLAYMTQEMIDVYKNMVLNRTVMDSNPFTCIIFDENCQIIDCNPKTLELYQFSSLEELNEGYRDFLRFAIPEYQPDGRESIPFEQRIRAAFDEGACEFEVSLRLFGKPIAFNTIMKRIEYKNKPAVVVYQFDLSTQKEIQKGLEYRGRLLQAASDISNLLLTAEADRFETTLHSAFEVLGRAADVDRVYLWKNTSDEEGRLFMTQIYEWSPIADPQQGNEYTVNIPYDEVMPEWRETIFLGESMNGPVKTMGQASQDQLLPQGIVSILIVPIFIQNQFWGFIGYDDCRNERVFSIMEENIIKTCGYMVMSFSDFVQNEIAKNLVAEKEEALSTARTKSNFLANMSHEIRTPMNAILGMTELIMHENTSDVVQSHAADIKNACRGLLALINDILDISKIESGRLEIIPVRYQISSLLIDVISIIKLRADKKGVAFIVNMDANLPGELVGDEIRIKQVLINLLNNAVKFTHGGYIKLAIRSETTAEGIMLECSVTDTGVGIRKEDIGKLFESFQQIDTRKNRNIEGTGLGLSITKQILEMMNGSISVESEYGVGSCFTARFPQSVSNSQPMAALTNPEKNSILVYENRSAYLDSISYALESLGCRYETCSNQSGLHEMLSETQYDYIFASALYASKTQVLAIETQPNAVILAINGDGSMPLESGIISISMPIHCLQIANILNGTYEGVKDNADGAATISMVAPTAKVLVVDDNVVNLKVAAGLLKTYEIKADTAVAGARAIEMIRLTKYDVVFMDHMMPEMDGIDTTVTIRRMEGDYYNELPIIALTANAVSGAREMFKAEGLNDYLAKPIEMTKLNEVLTRWIPKEKQMEKAVKQSQKDSSDLEISGLDVQKGIEYSGGSLENYLEILATYAADGEKRLKEIAQCYQDGDVKTLTTYAHALKSASANVGADDLTHLAAELEFAGRNKDTAYIDGHLKAFTDTLAITLTNIKCYLSSKEKKPAGTDKSADLDVLRKAVEDVSSSLENVNIEAIEVVLKEITSYNWDEEISSLLRQMKDCVGFFDYDGVESVLGDLKKLIH